MKNLSFLIAISYLIGSLLLNTGCQRSSGQVWEDTKSGGSYVHKGFRKAVGKRGGDSRASKLSSEAGSPVAEDYVPLKDDDLYNKLASGDADTLNKLNAYSSIPQSKLQPGEPGSNLPGIDGFKDPQELHLDHIFSTIHFETNDYVLKGDANRDIVKKVAEYLKQHPNLYVFLEGHCDERGTASYNLSLGSKRSNSVRTLLVKEGVNLEHLFSISYGKERPLALGHDETAWSQNRRVQFKLYEQPSEK